MYYHTLLPAYKVLNLIGTIVLHIIYFNFLSTKGILKLFPHIYMKVELHDFDLKVKNINEGRKFINYKNKMSDNFLSYSIKEHIKYIL